MVGWVTHWNFPTGDFGFRSLEFEILRLLCSELCYWSKLEEMNAVTN